MSEQNDKNANKRFIGKIKNCQGQYGAYQKIMIDNPKPLDKDGNPDQYHKGSLIWVDNETGELFLVKQVGIKGVSQGAAQNGFVGSLCIDLDNQYDVEKQNK